VPTTFSDPVDLVRAALGDAREVRPEHLPAISAAAQGLGVLARSVTAAYQRLGAAVARGDVDPADAKADVDWLGALSRRIEAASALLDGYAHVAVTAAGFDFDEVEAHVQSGKGAQ